MPTIFLHLTLSEQPTTSAIHEDPQTDAEPSDHETSDKSVSKITAGNLICDHLGALKGLL